jgi:hypothetical protein
MRAAWIFGAALGLAVGCANSKKDTEFEGLGRTGASSDPQPGMLAPVEPGDLDAVAQRGRLLYDMERALGIAYESGAFEVGIGEGNVVLPLVDVDPGGQSAQVVFLRWTADKVHQGEVRAADAERWIMVSLLLSPDRVLDVELLSGPVQKDGAEQERALYLITAAKMLQELADGQAFHMFTVTEQLPQKNEAGSTVQTRIYALSDRGDGPDFELVLARSGKTKKKRKPPTLLAATRVHPAGGAQADPMMVAAPFPAAATVARVLLRGPQAGEVEVKAQRGMFRVSADTGRIRRVDDGSAGGSPPAEAPPADAAAPPAEAAAAEDESEAPADAAQ